MTQIVSNGVGTVGTATAKFPPQLLRVRDLARAAGVRNRVVYAAIRAGRLQARRLGHLWRIHPTEAERWAGSLA